MNEERIESEAPTNPPDDGIRTMFYWIWRVETFVLVYEAGIALFRYGRSYLSAMSTGDKWTGTIPPTSDFSLSLVRIFCLIGALIILSFGAPRSYFSRLQVIGGAVLVGVILGIMYAYGGLNEAGLLFKAIRGLPKLF